MRWILQGIVGLALLLPGAAPAQRAAAGAPGVPGASLQTQLGAVPLVPPRGSATPQTVRTVRLTQLDPALAPIGAPRELTCPETGCQQLLALAVGNATEMFIADIQFVGRGAYLALQSRSLAIGSVVEFQKGRAGPVFIKDMGEGAMEQKVSYTVAAPGSVRKLETNPNPRTLTSGNVFTRKLEPDLILQIEILAPRPVE